MLRLALYNWQNVSRVSEKMSSVTSAGQEKIQSDWIGPPGRDSNLRPVKFYVPPDETALEREYRLQRQLVMKWNQEYWAKHNKKFIKVRSSSPLFSFLILTVVLLVMVVIGGSRGAPPARVPQQDQFLLFLHTFLPKSVRVGGWHPPNGSAPPQQEILDLPLVVKFSIETNTHYRRWE